ncbi:LysE family translocator [Marinomonas sp. C2222]|uniref:LysE family translocator n=1 Tax=Marinomonas sargassi TaxID=2984494 RepID=A0ABT2YRK0_9GAMM|nr:LysE family translocator [Marinomonas sargassi]MCV2402519.1 LysE family translocator [Marinomonas sargassi]
MELINLLLFIPACFALSMAPGPNNLLAMNNARCYGLKAAMIAGFGRIVVFSIMIVLAASGLAVVLYTSEMLFLLIKLVGALYLLWLAFNLWRSDVSPITDVVKTKNYRGLFKQEFLLAAGNPKAILVFTAFLPQFVNVEANVTQQFYTLGAMSLVLEYVALTIYAMFGVYLRQWFSKPAMAKRFNRGCALFLGFSGGNLLLARN